MKDSSAPVVHHLHQSGVHSLTMERGKNHDDAHQWEIVYSDFTGWRTRGRPALVNGKLSAGALSAITAYQKASGAAFGTLDEIQSTVRSIHGIKGAATKKKGTQASRERKAHQRQPATSIRIPGGPAAAGK